MIPFLVESQHRQVKRGEDGEQSFSRKTSDVGVEAVEVEGV